MTDGALYDEVAARYHQWVSQDGVALEDPTFDDLVGDVSGQGVCAVACGAGREARFLAQRGAVVTGVDLSEGLLDIARTEEEADPLGITYLCGNAHDLSDLDDASFDGVVCYMALMDIPNLDLALGAMARILKLHGWFVVVITHPCFKTPAYGEIVDHVDGSVRRTVGKYFDEGPWDGPGRHTDRLPSRAYHRTLSSYLNALHTAGLRIEQAREPKLDTPVWQQAACLLYLRGTRIVRQP